MGIMLAISTDKRKRYVVGIPLASRLIPQSWERMSIMMVEARGTGRYNRAFTGPGNWKKEMHYKLVLREKHTNMTARSHTRKSPWKPKKGDLTNFRHGTYLVEWK